MGGPGSGQPISRETIGAPKGGKEAAVAFLKGWWRKRKRKRGRLSGTNTTLMAM